MFDIFTHSRKLILSISQFFHPAKVCFVKVSYFKVVYNDSLYLSFDKLLIKDKSSKKSPVPGNLNFSGKEWDVYWINRIHFSVFFVNFLI